MAMKSMSMAEALLTLALLGSGSAALAGSIPVTPVTAAQNASTAEAGLFAAQDLSAAKRTAKRPAKKPKKPKQTGKGHLGHH